ncbi:hypothetical protein OIU84_006079 [Salix udensis]|uniref:Uncharacterized protein n=1 Tax=Salix udensis TaxID=889485 RepID=A0AAD6JYH2_9ROSI|nr:hypothetical protein OIU84_006079 [Salix udensis]
MSPSLRRCIFNMKVENLSRKLITPSNPTPPHLEKLKISCLDQLLPPLHVSCIFYYQSSAHDELGVNNFQRSEQLQKSLSETLTIFYPLSGRYSRSNFSIHCSDQGVEFVEAQVKGCCLSQLLKGGELETKLRNQLAPTLFVPDDSPLVKVHFNMFECGGLAISVSISHVVADAFTLFTFVNAWATASRVGIEKLHRPSFELSSLCPPREMHPRGVLNQGEAEENKIVTIKYVFNGTDLSKLKLEAANGSADGSRLLKEEPTRVEIVTAVIWRSLIRVARARRGYSTPSVLAIPVNMRGRACPSIPQHCCGNFVHYAFARFNPDDENNLQFHELVGEVHDAIKSAIKDCGKACNGDEICLMAINDAKELAETLGKDGVDGYLFSSWCRFAVYEADFGFGKPDWVSNLDNEMECFVFFMDTKDGEGIEAWVGLDDKSVLLFQQDLGILN